MPSDPVVTFQGREYPVAQHPELAIDGVTPWCVEIEGAYYRVGNAGPDARRFARERLRNHGAYPPPPSYVAGKRYPLMFVADGAIVRAWPAFVPRNRGAKTYVSPASGDRVATVKGPMWLFAFGDAEPLGGGTATLQQTLTDVREMAIVALRSL